MRQLADLASRLSNGLVWMRSHKGLLSVTLLFVLVAWIPLYGILFPPLVDLPEHLIISKLLWELLTGVSHLDLEISWILGYRLFPALTMIVFPWFKLWGIPFVFLPRFIAMMLMGIHVIVIAAILFPQLKDKPWRSRLLALCFALPAIVCMYSACWFIGFVNYTLAISVLVAALFLTERFLDSGKPIDAFWLFVSLVMVYAAHPFALAFWVMWGLSRGLAGAATQTISVEWKRLISLPFIFAPIVLYHVLATRNTSLAPSSHSVLTQPPVPPLNDWYQNRIRPFFDGTLLKPDDAADSRFFARFALGLILVTAILVFRASQNSSLRKAMLACVVLMFGASLINEKFVPVPAANWLAYDYRFSSTVYAIALAFSAMALIRLLPNPTDKSRYKTLFIALAVLSVSASAVHLKQVRKAYKRYDVQARKYMAKVFRQEKPTGISLPHSRWHPDGTLIKLFVCLEQPDCNLPGTTFYTGYVKELFAVKLRSPARLLSRREMAAWRKREPSGPLVGHWQLDEASADKPCLDSSENKYPGIAKGTTVVEGKIGNARSFNGRGDAIEIPAINIPGAITVAAWVYSTNFRHNGFVVTKNPVNTQWALIFENDGNLKWRGVGFEKSVKCAAPANNAWHHVVGTHNGTTGSIYVDGVLCASGPLPAIGNAAGSITIGGFAGGQGYYFLGRIDDVRIYNRALSDGEISELFALGQAGSLPTAPEAASK